MLQSWSLVIFSFNEAGNIQKVLQSVRSLCKDHFYNREYEVIVVDDGSNDGSEEYILDFTKRNAHFVLLRNESNMGIGNALLKGYRACKYENICAIPGDGQFDIFELSDYLDFPEENYISFYRPQKEGYTWFRNFLSSFNRQTNKLFLRLNLLDVNWIKVYKIKQLSVINMNLRSSLIESEICAKLNLLGFKVIEVESKYLNRDFGNSKGGSIRTVSKATFELFKLVWEIIKFRIKKTKSK